MSTQPVKPLSSWAKSLQAHTPPPGGQWHALVDHLLAVADLAEEFASAFGMAQEGHALGLAHDLGKAAPAFQRYLTAAHQGLRLDPSPHSDPGAVAVQDMGALTFVICGHHGGLPSVTDWRTRIRKANADASEAAKKLREELAIPGVQLADRLSKAPVQGEMALRLLLSALVDADRLDSERAGGGQPRPSYPPLTQYRDALESHLADLKGDDSPVNQVRRQVQAACRVHGPAGFYRLTVPTGGGKTLASALFALTHACQEEAPKRRVVYAIPYTSIIEQNAAVFRRIFQNLCPYPVLEHHSSVEGPDDESQRPHAFDLAAENWDHPFIVTTNSQLFDSLFARKPSQVRKLHRLAQSVIILDEVQSLPADMLEPCLDALAWLVREAGATVLFCTATQPDYSHVPNLPEPLRSAQEVVPEPSAHFALLKRVKHEHLGSLSSSEVAARVREEEQALVILNTRKDAISILDDLNDPAALHLSTLLCPSHRKRVLAEVKERLTTGAKCIVVATQVVEAGVDLDFPVVFRASGPLPSVIQAGGRCNREGRLEFGRCFLFDLVDGGMPPGEYRVSAAASRSFLASRLHELEMPEVQSEYFRLVLNDLTLATDRKLGGLDTVQSLRRSLDFPEVARLARLIREDTTQVLIRSELAEERAAELEVIPILTRSLWRELAPFCVSLRAAEVHGLRQFIHAWPSGVLEWTGAYHPVRGLQAQVRPVEEMAF